VDLMSVYDITIRDGFMINPSLLNEKVHSAADRKKMPKKMFGIPSLKKYPLDDPEHVSKAKTYFKDCPEGHEEELAKNILQRSLQLEMKIKASGEWFKALDDEQQEAIKDNFKKDGSPNNPKRYPHYLLSADFLNEAVSNIIEEDSYLLGSLIDGCKTLLNRGNTTIPEEGDLGIIFDNVLTHLSDVVTFVEGIKKEIPHYSLNIHFALCDEECSKNDERLELINKLYPKVMMNQHIIKEQLPERYRQLDVYRLHIDNDRFGWNGKSFQTNISLEDFAPRIMDVGSDRELDTLEVWNKYYLNKDKLQDLARLNLNTADIFETLRYSKKDDMVDSYNMNDTKYFNAIITRASWLKRRITEVALEYHRGSLNPGGKSEEYWVDKMTNEVILADILAITGALNIWAMYNSAKSTIEELYAKMPILVKELSKLE